MEILKYKEEFNELWDDFVLNKSLNGTVYQTRQFLSYHRDRFIDESILIYLDNNLICVVPCCKNGDRYFSHKGSTYGGPVITLIKLSVSKMESLINKIFEYYDNKFECRLANNIYFSEEISLLYYLIGRKLNIKLELSWYIDTSIDLISKITNKSNKTYLLKMINDKENYLFKSTDDNNDYLDFYELLEKSLSINHSTSPTHSKDEFLLLKNILLDKQELFIIKKNNILLGGIFIIKVTKYCWYNVYIARNLDIQNSGISIIYIMNEIIKKGYLNGVKYLDYGISTENGGNTLNIGLSEFKNESFGGKSNFRYLMLNKNI